MSEPKSNEKAVECRSEGNKFYSSRSFHSALLKYNESLCLAEMESENVGLAYANRSAVYLEMKLFERCQANIELAKLHNYPKENLEILEKREEKCRQLMNHETKASGSFFKLSHPPHKKLPYIIENLEVREDPKFGRYVITNKSLRVGDIIAIEKPFCSVLLAGSSFVSGIPESNIFQRCTNCLKDNALDLIPCSFCCRAMFCSTKCLEVAHKRFHRFECPIMDKLTEPGSGHMNIRLFFIALSTFDDSIEKLESFFKEKENENSTAFDVDDESNTSEKNRFHAFISLSRSSRLSSVSQLEEILTSHPDLAKSLEPHLDFIRLLLERFIQIGDSSFHGIFSGSTKQDENSDAKTISSNLQQPIGNGSMLFCALINHSCSGNVFRVYFEGQIAIVVCRPIQKGSQLFDGYNTSFVGLPKADRQAKLFKEFGFMCDCEACTNNYPTPPALPVKDVKLMKFAKKTDEEIMKQTFSQAHKKFRTSCELLERNHHSFPSVELFMLQKCIATFLLTQARPSVLFP